MLEMTFRAEAQREASPPVCGDFGTTITQQLSSNVAVGSTIRFPPGDEDDLRGKGDFILEPFIAASQEYDRFHLHLLSGEVVE